MTESCLIQHIDSHLEPQVQDYVEVRTNEVMLKMISKFVKKGICPGKLRVREQINNRKRRDCDVRRRSPDDRRNRDWRERNHGFENRNLFDRGNRGFECRKGQYQVQNRGSSDYFNRGDKRHGSHLNSLRVRVDQNDQSLTHVLYHEIDSGGKPPVVSTPYRYDRVKQSLIGYHMDKMLRAGKTIPISPVVLCLKNKGLPLDNPKAYRFVFDYRKLNAITKFPRYPLPIIEDLVTNTLHMNILSSLDLLSGFFQLAVKPSDVVKTTFVTKNGIFAFTRMPFFLSGAVPNFQKVIDIILKSLLGYILSLYVDDVIHSSPSFAHHVENLREVFSLLQEAWLMLNKESVSLVAKN
ncbi:retrovirus-related Pol polyprotein from transposon opus [Trichonephila clavipes]|nr:retrovirus-related Pol polyprotein from transposon opus [Trichonephila clavipes]